MKKLYKINKPEGVKLKNANVTINNDEIIVEVEINDEFQPKDGDFIKFECCDREGLFIYKKGKYDDYCGCYCGISSEYRNNGLNGKLILCERDCHESKFYCRFATAEEKEFFIKRLKNECNKQLNPETKKIGKYKVES